MLLGLSLGLGRFSRLGVEELETLLAQIALDERIDRAIGIDDAVVDQRSELAVETMLRDVP